MRREDHTRTSEEANTRCRVDEVLSEGKARFEDEVRNVRRDAEAVRSVTRKTEADSRESAKSGLLLGNDVTILKSVEQTSSRLARMWNAFVPERHRLR